MRVEGLQDTVLRISAMPLQNLTQKTHKVARRRACDKYACPGEEMVPIRRCLRLTNRSLLRTKPPILITSHATSSCSTFSACTQYEAGYFRAHRERTHTDTERRRQTCARGTLRASNLIVSRALIIMYGSHVLRVVFTVIDPG